jgi:hypothetical protein
MLDRKNVYLCCFAMNPFAPVIDGRTDRLNWAYGCMDQVELNTYACKKKIYFFFAIYFGAFTKSWNADRQGDVGTGHSWCRHASLCGEITINSLDNDCLMAQNLGDWRPHAKSRSFARVFLIQPWALSGFDIRNLELNFKCFETCG